MTTPAYASLKEPIRLIRGALTVAERTSPRFGKVRTSRLGVAQANGVRYENKVHRAIATLAKTLGAKVEKNPWFHFRDANGDGACSPDCILWLDPGFALIIEVKYTWVPGASVKLKGLYLPVINCALRPHILRSLVICKTLVPGSPEPISGILEGTAFTATASQAPVYHWLGQGPLVW